MGRACNILWVAERTLCEILRHRSIFGLQLFVSPKNIGHHLKLVPIFLLFVQNSWCSLKKCHHFKSFTDFLLFLSNFFSNQFTFPNFVPNQLRFLFRLEIKAIGQELTSHRFVQKYSDHARPCKHDVVHVITYFV